MKMRKASIVSFAFIITLLFAIGVSAQTVSSKSGKGNQTVSSKSGKGIQTLSSKLGKGNLKTQKTIHLFNRQNLEGWYTYIKDRGRNNDPKAVFTVNDKLLHISGEEWGCITTDKEYKDYKLVVEYKWGNKTYGERATKAFDNGILLHSQGEDGAFMGIWMHAIECNVIEGGNGRLYCSW